jgi:hypothetical protein
MLSKVGIIRACLRYFTYYKMIRFDIKWWVLESGPTGKFIAIFCDRYWSSWLSYLVVYTCEFD